MPSARYFIAQMAFFITFQGTDGRPPRLGGAAQANRWSKELKTNLSPDEGVGSSANPNVGCSGGGALPYRDGESAVAVQAGALAYGIGSGNPVLAGEPLGDGGVEGAGDRVLRNADTGHEGADSVVGPNISRLGDEGGFWEIGPAGKVLHLLLQRFKFFTFPDSPSLICNQIELEHYFHEY